MAGRVREGRRGRKEGSKVGALAQALAGALKEALEVAVEAGPVAHRLNEAAPEVLVRPKAGAGTTPIRSGPSRAVWSRERSALIAPATASFGSKASKTASLFLPLKCVVSCTVTASA